MSFASILASGMDSIDNNCRTLRTVASYFVFSMHLVSIKTACLLAIDRYIGFIFCFRYNNIMNKKNIIRTLSLIWFSSFSINAFATLDKNILPYSSFIELRHSTCIIFATAVFFGAIFLFAIHAHLYLVAKAQLSQEENQQIAVFGRNAELRDLRWQMATNEDDSGLISDYNFLFGDIHSNFCRNSSPATKRQIFVCSERIWTIVLLESRY